MALDIKRCVIGREMGNKTVDPNATFQAGMIAQYGSTGNIVTSDGTAPAGVFKYNKTSSVYGVAVKEAIVLMDTTATNLNHANVSNVKVENAAGTDYTPTTDYTVGTTNGTITRNGAGITNGATVYVTYTYQYSEADKINEGKNFALNFDDTLGSNKITFIQGFSTIYTDQYDTSLDYTVGQTLYVTGTGKFTTQNFFGGKSFGKVVSVPTASDPFLGVEGTFTNDR